MTDSEKHNRNAAVCIGDFHSSKELLAGICGKLMDADINIHVFNGFTCDYNGGPHDVGQTSIFGLPNYEMLDILIVAPFFLSSSDEIIDKVINRALSANIPVISVGMPHDGCYCVMSDYTEQTEYICDHFIKHHHCKKINFISGTKGQSVAELRLEGYRRSLEKNGIPFDISRVYYGDFWQIPTEKAIDKMLSDAELPEAIVCANDTMALAAISRLSQHGYEVPRDVLVSGMDGIDEAEDYVTTAHLLGKDTGELTASVAVKILNGEKVEKTVIVPPLIRFGYSCGCSPDSMNISIEKRHRLYEEVFNSRKHSQMALRLNQEITNSSTLKETMDAISAIAGRIWADHLWVCLCDDFLSGISTEDITDAEEVLAESDRGLHRGCYSDRMYCAVTLHDKQYGEPCVFDTKQMLPDFYLSADKAKCILYSPLHFKDICVGYLAFDFFPWSSLLFLLNIVTMGIATALESIKRQSELYAYAKKIGELYITDPLTGLYNRRGFFRLYNELKESSRQSRMVISMDLDNLKQINDNYGHSEGDNAITVTSDTLKRVFSDGQICARFGGDEFVVLGDCPDDELMYRYAERLREGLNEYNVSSGKPYNVHLSLGCCLIPADADKPIDQYIIAADAKMYIDKETHKRRRARSVGSTDGVK